MTTNDATPRDELVDHIEEEMREMLGRRRSRSMIADLFSTLGPGTSVTYIGQEDELWWVELRLPESRYTATLATDSGSTLDEAFVATAQRALTFAKKGQEDEDSR